MGATQVTALTFKVGAKLFAVGDSYAFGKHGQEVEVTKVGRKWAELDGGRYRADLQTGQIDGGEYLSPGRLYPSREAYQAELALDKGWFDLRHAVNRHSAPAGVTLERIAEARKLLGLEQKS